MTSVHKFVVALCKGGLTDEGGQLVIDWPDLARLVAEEIEEALKVYGGILPARRKVFLERLSELKPIPASKPEREEISPQDITVEEAFSRDACEELGYNKLMSARVLNFCRDYYELDRSVSPAIQIPKPITHLSQLAALPPKDLRSMTGTAKLTRMLIEEVLALHPEWPRATD